MEYLGNIKKMRSSLEETVQYKLPIGDDKVPMNQFLGKRVVMEHLHQINCVKCGRETKKSFAQGFCYPCFISAPETEECVLRPELCQAQNGIARDMAYATLHCLNEHVVYLSITSGLKVGVTRHTQVPTRWIDQGAVKVIELARTPNRYTAGLIEVAMKSHLNDKTNWRKMLTGEISDDISLPQVKAELQELIPENLRDFYLDDDREYSIRFPVEAYPIKIKSLNFDKTEVIDGILKGIKGQYLIFEDNSVINIRKFGGYQIRLSV